MFKPLPIATLALAGALAVALLMPAPTRANASDKEPDAKPNWVFNGKGQKTDQVKLVGMSVDDALFPININHHWGLMNQKGEVVVFPRYQWTDYAYEGYTRYVQNGKTGYLRGDPSDDNDPDEFFIIASYDYADRFSSGAAVVSNDGKWGLIDRAGKTLVPMEYDGVLRMQDGFAAVQRGDLCGFVNRAGRLKIPLQYKRVRSFHNGYAAVQLTDGKWGYIDKRGKQVWLDESGRVRMLGDFHEQYARVQVQVDKGETRWGYITKAFRVHIDPTYEDARDFHDGLAAVKTDGKWGFITGKGRWAIEPRFEEVDDFDDAEGTNDFEDADRVRDERDGRDLSTAGLYAMVKIDGRWGYVNRVVSAGLEPQFKEAEPFFRGLAKVSRGAGFAYVSETGHVRFDPFVAVELGIVDRTAAEDARLKLGVGREFEPGNQIIDAPPLRQATKVPYISEHLYVEMLPAEKP